MRFASGHGFPSGLLNAHRVNCSFGRSAARRVQAPAVHRVVRDYVADAIDRAKSGRLVAATRHRGPETLRNTLTSLSGSDVGDQNGMDAGA